VQKEKVLDMISILSA